MRRRRSANNATADLVHLLPPPGMRRRWSPRAKAAVVMALRSGKLILSEVYERYQLSAEELSRWEDAFDREGIAGLQARALARRSRQNNVT